MDVIQLIKEQQEMNTSALLDYYRSEIADYNESDEDELTTENVIAEANRVSCDDWEAGVNWHLGIDRVCNTLISKLTGDNVVPVVDVKARVINGWKDRLDRAIDNLESGDERKVKDGLKSLEKLSTDLLLSK